MTFRLFKYIQPIDNNKHVIRKHSCPDGENQMNKRKTIHQSFMIFILILAIIIPLRSQERPMVLGYYPSWNKTVYPHTLIPFDHLTHICHAFIFPYEDGSLDLSSFTYDPELIAACHANGVKVIISVGGWDTERTPRFAVMAQDSAARRAFVENITQFCIDNGYDGIDMDWEYPPADIREFTSMLFRELRSALSRVNKPMSLSIAAPSADPNDRYDWSVMNEVLDWVGVMTYDYYGSWTAKAGPNSPLYGTLSTTDQGWIDRSVNHYMNEKGVSPEKLCIGTPFYGWQFEASAMYGPITGARQLRYFQIEPLISDGWTRYWDNATRTPYLINPERTRVISYDDPESIIEKCNYIKYHGLRGTIIWALGQDFINNKTVLLDILGSELSTYIRVLDRIAQPAACELRPNFPNPFNTATRIPFSLKHTDTVNIRILSIDGKYGFTLVRDTFEPGSYEITFQASSLPSGIYFCIMETGNTIQTRKMALVK